MCVTPLRQVPEELDAGPEEAGHDGQGAAEGAVRGGAAAAGVLHRSTVVQAPRLRHLLDIQPNTRCVPCPAFAPLFLPAVPEKLDRASTKPVILLFEVRCFDFFFADGCLGLRDAGGGRHGRLRTRCDYVVDGNGLSGGGREGVPLCAKETAVISNPGQQASD